ncbi:MAG: hypothetical protein Q8M57_10460 [Nitrosomonas sp.]|uniref:hypothetical protein n=1 Tax=Nitrosomonas sp. TaxID=42353 RepID=UPI002733294E|nr:hypothetical protein [Nitrosomonas sp.]MDP3281449.1 hypothetical protein [Nitrosomonas sp.]
MSYKNIDHDRFFYLIIFGLEPNTITQFFKENRTLLIQAGIKVQNIPKLPKKLVELIISKFSDRSYPIFEKFIRQHLKVIDPVDVQLIINRFKQAEENDEEFNIDEKKKYCESTLYYLFSDDTSEELLGFLQTSVSGARKNLAKKLPSLPIEILPDYIPTLVSSTLGHYDDSLSEHFPDYLHHFFSALTKIKQGENVDGIKISLESFPILFSALAEAEFAKTLTDSTKAEDSGVICMERIPLSSIENLHLSDIEVLAHCLNVSHDKDKCFLEPIALIRKDGMAQLSKSLWSELFPTSGQLIAFADTPGLRLPSKGEYGVWQVEEFMTDRPIKCRVQRKTKQVFEVYQLGVPSANYDDVKAIIAEFPGKTFNRPLFLLSDGIIVRFKHDIDDFSRETFDEPLDAWFSLVALRDGTRTLVCGPLPPADFTYDCSDLDRVLKNLIKIEQELNVIPHLTKAQTSKVVFALRDAAKELDVKRLDYINTKLDFILEADEVVGKLISVILVHPKIVAEINKVKELAEQVLLTHKNDLIQDIEKLKVLKSDLQQDLKHQQSEQLKLPVQVGKAVRLAFNEAREHGLKSFAESTVIGALMEALGETRASSGIILGDQQNHRSRQRYIFPEQEINFEQFLTQSGFLNRWARGIRIAIDTALQVGLSIIFYGTFASMGARKFSQSMSKKSVCTINVPVGWIDPDHIDECLDNSEKWDVILINNYNLSAIESYGSRLLMLQEDRLWNKAVSQDLLIVASVSDSVAALPRSHSFEKMSLSINLDQKSYADDKSLLLFNDYLDELSRNGTSQKLPLIKSMREIINVLGGLESEEQSLAIPIIIAGTIDSLAELL